MKRRTPMGTDHQTVAGWAQEGRWWASRAQSDQPLTPAETARYRALRDQNDAPDLAVDAIIAASAATPAVAAGIRERWA